MREEGLERDSQWNEQLEKEEHKKEPEMSLTLRGERQLSLGQQGEGRGCQDAASLGRLSSLGRSLGMHSKEYSTHHCVLQLTSNYSLYRLD